MNGKNKTEDKLVESLRKNKAAAEKKKDEKAGSSEDKKSEKTPAKSPSAKSGFISSKRVWPD